jgi:hypothetical protein
LIYSNSLVFSYILSCSCSRCSNDSADSSDNAIHYELHPDKNYCNVTKTLKIIYDARLNH